MRSILRSTCALVVVACALCSVAAASASANGYRIENKAISSTVEGTITSGASELKYEDSGARFAIKSQKSTGTFSLETGGLAKETINLEGNALYEVNGKGEDVLLSSCTVPTITLAAKADLSLFNGELAGAFAPKNEGGIFANIAIDGSSCALRKADGELVGTMTGLLPAAEVSEATHVVSFNPAEAKSQSLRLSDETAELTSSESLSLSGANASRPWSAVSGSGREESPEGAFRVEGKAVSSSVGISGTGGASTLAGKLLGYSVTIKCTGGSSAGTLEGSGLSTASSSLTGCSLREVKEGKETELPKCTVGTIAISDKGNLRFYGEELASELSPSSGVVFANFPITGSSCLLKKASNELIGSFGCVLPEAGREKVEHQLSCKPGEAETNLKLNGEPATLEATETLKLTGTSAGKKWSAV
jgi:hypothetical protein